MTSHKGNRARQSRLSVALITITILITLSSPARADVVTDWNQTTLATQTAEPGGIRTPPASRALAMVHAAIHDSLNAIDRRYGIYAVDVQAPAGTSPEAAVATAAHRVLVSLYPNQQVSLGLALTASLLAIPNGTSKTDGMALGEAVANAILALRSGDGSSTNVPYAQTPAPGVFQPMPPPATFVGWGNVTPFTLVSGSQFRAEGPHDLSSTEYAADFNEVKSLGRLTSTTRTADQTEAAHFWAENSQIHWNNIARSLTLAKGNGLWENARLFALLNLAFADAAIACFDSKYSYNFWRPIAAIPAADTDGNDDTIADPTWVPLRPTPGHPDYTSQHSAIGGAAAEVLALFFGEDKVSFSFTTSTAPGGVMRSYESFSQAAKENMMSRIWLGFHTRTACRHGLNQGSQVAHWVSKKFLKPVN
jgi:hypothetical protein